MTDHEVVIAGGGPTGLMLAAELMLAGIDVMIVEPRPSQELDGSRAGGLHPRTLEVLDQRGVVDRFLAEGQTYPAAMFGFNPLPLGDFPSRHNCLLGLWQSAIERILAGWVLDDLGVPILRGHRVHGLTQHDDGVDVDVIVEPASSGPTSDGNVLRAQYLVGCDGGRSAVRTAAGIAFEGLDASTSWMIAEVEMDGDPEFGFRHDANGTHAMDRRAPDDPIRVVITEPSADHAGRPDLDDLRSALVGVWGSDFGLRSATWISRFTDATRHAATYRDGRVLIAGDAAHIHPPQGGQGLNVGVQDAVNLGWKLAQVVRGTSPASLLDSYHDERHPVGARVIASTQAMVALATPDARHQSLRDTVAELVAFDEPRRLLAGLVTGLDIHYDLGGDHPLVGRRMPDLDLDLDLGLDVGPGGEGVGVAAGVEQPSRVYELLHDARPLLLELTGAPRFDVSPWAGRVRGAAGTAPASACGTWDLPVVGAVPAPPAVLVRPDGYVAWAGSVDDPALPAALDRWFGTAT